jgi:flagellar hook-associated protein 2
MTAERKPIQSMNAQKATLEEKGKLLSDIVSKVQAVKGLMPNLNTPIAIRELSVMSGDEKVVTGTADKSVAFPGDHRLEVVNLATSASAISNGFEDHDSTRVGTGYFTVTGANGESKDIFIDNENATLDGLARSINNAKIGLRASVVNDQSDPDNPFHLMLTAEGTGSQNNVQYPDFYFVDGESDFYIDKENPSKNATVRYQGFEIETPSNEVKDLIPGVTLNLKGTTETDRAVEIKVNQDIPKTTLKVKDMVEKLNGVFSFIQGQNKMDENTPADKTLGGDYGIRVSEQRLRQSLSQNFIYDPNRKVKSLGDLGIQFNKNGTLNFDDKKFENTLNANYDEVVDLLAGDGRSYGIIPSLSRTLDSIAGGPNGVLTAQKQTQVEKIQRLQKDIDRREQSALKKQEDLKGKLARTQTAISNAQRQSAQIGQFQQGGPGSLMQLLGG